MHFVTAVHIRPAEDDPSVGVGFANDRQHLLIKIDDTLCRHLVARLIQQLKNQPVIMAREALRQFGPNRNKDRLVGIRIIHQFVKVMQVEDNIQVTFMCLTNHLFDPRQENRPVCCVPMDPETHRHANCVKTGTRDPVEVTG